MAASILIAGEPAVRRSSYARVVRSLGNVIEAGFDEGAAIDGYGADVFILCATADTSRKGIELLMAHAATHPDAPVVVISEHAGEDLAIAALRSRVRHYLTGPVECGNLLRAVHACLQTSAARPARVAISELGLIGASLSTQRVREYAPLAARSDCPVLITGETGTGKELVAEFVHASSTRAGKALVPLNCAAIPESLLESELFGYERGAFTGATASRDGKMRQAHGGTLFLDEIGELGQCAQAKILRAIETKEVQRLGGHGSLAADFRVVAATNQDLEALVATRVFRQDLFFRLNVARIRLAPLRERREDIPVLLEHYLAYFNGKTGQAVRGYTEGALDLLGRYCWPGNVRELRNTVEAMLIVRPWPLIDVPHLPDHIVSAALPSGPASAGGDRALLVDALRVTNWNKTKAARSLHLSRMTLYRKMAKYGISERATL